VDDAAGVGADDVEVRRLAPPRLRLRDVDRHTPCGPDVIEVHAAGHDHHERIEGTELWYVEHLVLDRLLGITEAIGAYELRVHLRRYLADRRQLTDLVQLLAHGN